MNYLINNIYSKIDYNKKEKTINKGKQKLKILSKTWKSNWFNNLSKEKKIEYKNAVAQIKKEFNL